MDIKVKKIMEEDIHRITDEENENGLEELLGQKVLPKINVGIISCQIQMNMLAD